MIFKGVDFWPHKRIFPVMGLRKYFLFLTIGLALLSVIELFILGLNFGIDFKGGSLFEVRSSKAEISIPDLKRRMNALDLGDVQVQEIQSLNATSKNEALIRIEQQPGGEKVQQEVVVKVREALKGTGIEIRRQEVVGAAVSAELKQAGLIAVICAMIGIMLYVWFRFEWQFGVAAILALVHDVFITLGLFSLLGLEFNLSIVAALLTLAGYSINDTVVVFDRIRENLRKYKKMPLEELLNLSINETLSRTVITSVTTFFAVLALFIFGTEAIRGFSFAMLFGIVIGTWSSIFIASPFLL
ncbi:MAG: protein translocase subunit SecF, partial [Pseudomonadota bacterium]